MGVLAPGSAHARPSAQPPTETSGNVLPHVSAKSPSNLGEKFEGDLADTCGKKSYPNFQNPRTIFEKKKGA